MDVVNFMGNIAVKDSIEKDSFFKKLPSILPSIPPAVAVRKVGQAGPILTFSGQVHICIAMPLSAVIRMPI